MYPASLTLVGFSLATVCVSICPMNMSPMSMEDDGMQMMVQAMHHGEESKDMDCEMCEQRGEDLAFASATAVSVSSGTLQAAVISSDISPLSSQSFYQRGDFLSDVGPPLPGNLLVGTVVLRT